MPCHGRRAFISCLLVLSQALPTSAVISRWRTKKIGEDTEVSPIAGCVGFDCVTSFVALPDSSYSWYDTGERIHGYEPQSKAKWTGYVLNMTSQTWMSESNPDHPLWWHILTVVVPDNLEFKDFASLSLDFGMNLPQAQLVRIDNRDNEDVVENSIQPCIAIDSTNLKQRLPQLKYAVSKIAYVASNARTVGVSLLDVPNSYEVFGTDVTKRRRAMDFLKAYAWVDFMRSEGKQPERLSELPVAKALVRAMDTVTAFTQSNLPSGKVTRFGVTGYSKLGTAAWMAGALDPRVEAIAPAAIAFDVRGGAYNITPVIEATRDAEMTAPPRDFLDLKDKGLIAAVATEYAPVADYFEGDAFDKLHSIVDPSAWISRLTVPKLYIMGTNDFCFQDSIDDVHGVFDQMLGQKAFVEIPNCKHEDTLVKALPTIAAFFHGVLIKQSVPEIWSEFEKKIETGFIRARLVSHHTPLNVTLWTADTSLSRDFKNAKWTPKKLKRGSSWEAKLVKHWGTGYRAGFIEFKYAYPDDDHVYSTSTPVAVVPTKEL